MDWTLLKTIISRVNDGLPTFAAAVFVLVGGRFFFLRSTPFDSRKELFGEPNTAYALALGAYLFSAGIALMGGFFGGRGANPWMAAGSLLINGVLTLGLLRSSIAINDRFILSSFSIAKEIARDRNVGVGFCVAGSTLACGLTLNGAMTGFSDDFGHGIRDLLVFWLLGQIVLVAVSVGYSRTMKYDVHRLIEFDDNVAVGLGFGGFLTGVGIIVRSSLKLADTREGHLLHAVVETAVLATIGALLLLAVDAMVLRLLFPKTRYEDEVEMKGNLAVGVVSVAANLAVALFLGSILQRGAF
jgi:uncharacterized membrane protein YjfL (UPF0719 family)